MVWIEMWAATGPAAPSTSRVTRPETVDHAPHWLAVLGGLICTVNVGLPEPSAVPVRNSPLTTAKASTDL